MVTAVVKKTEKPLPSLPDAGFPYKKIINYGQARYGGLYFAFATSSPIKNINIC